jgi:inorganic pyrophosphatase
MPKIPKKKAALANPSFLKPLDADDDGLLQVVVETPKGSRNKYAFDERQRLFSLKKVLPAGMAFPFVPSTLADDGDPTDVLVLMDEPAFPGRLLKCRMVGIIEREQGKKKNRERNDRIVAVEADNHSFADTQHVDDLGRQFVRELEEFFVNYHRLSGKEYRILAMKGPSAAKRCLKKGMRAFAST